MAQRRPIDEAKKGSAEILILSVVEDEAHHGYQIAKLIEQRSNGDLRFTLASLYATLYRLEDRGWIAAEWGVSPLGRRAKFYRLTPAGRRQLQSETKGWTEYVAAIGSVLRTTLEPS